MIGTAEALSNIRPIHGLNLTWTCGLQMAHHDHRTAAPRPAAGATRSGRPSRKQSAQGLAGSKSGSRGATELQLENGVWVVHRLDQLCDVAEIREGRCLCHLDDPSNHGLHGRDVA